MVWTDIAALRYNIGYCKDIKDYSVISWPVVGRVNAHDGIAGCYMIPVSGKTNTVIEMFLWAQRFLINMGTLGYEDGWAFCEWMVLRPKPANIVRTFLRSWKLYSS